MLRGGHDHDGQYLRIVESIFIAQPLTEARPLKRISHPDDTPARDMSMLATSAGMTNHKPGM
jgi:hypothetical protein